MRIINKLQSENDNLSNELHLIKSNMSLAEKNVNMKEMEFERNYQKLMKEKNEIVVKLESCINDFENNYKQVGDDIFVWSFLFYLKRNLKRHRSIMKN